MKRIFIAFAVVLFALLAWLCQYVWLPDILLLERRRVKSVQAANGETFEVHQWWNQIDFYSVEFQHTTTNRKKFSCLIDGDSSKWWRCRIEIDQKDQKVRVFHDGELEANYDIRARRLTRQNGVTVSANITSTEKNDGGEVVSPDN